MRGKLGWIAATVFMVAATVALAAWLFDGPSVPNRDLRGLTGDIGRGAYVARLAGCIGCHTDTKARGSVLAGGAGIETDFGTFYAPNITPHDEDGIGKWSVADFARALTAGETPNGEHYYPSFPYAFYTRLSNQDIVDLWAAVRSVPPVAGRVKPHDLKFPFNNTEGIGVWKRLFFESGELEPSATESDALKRGRYLALGPAHCGACHTPRNLLGGRDTDRRFEGGVGPGGEKIPPITSEILSTRGWTSDDLIYALRTGIKPDGDVMGGTMAEVVRDGTRYWTDADLAAIAKYLMKMEVGR